MRGERSNRIEWPSDEYADYFEKRRQFLDTLKVKELFANSYTFPTQDNKWWQIEVPNNPYDIRESSSLDCYEELVNALRSQEDKKMPWEERKESNPEHDLVIDFLDANWERFYPDLKPQQDSKVEVHQAICFKEVDLEEFGKVDFAAIIPDGTLIIIEIGKVNVRRRQLKDQIAGIKNLVVDHELTILPFFCRYDFKKVVNFANATAAMLRKLTIKPVRPNDGDWPSLRI